MVGAEELIQPAAGNVGPVKTFLGLLGVGLLWGSPLLFVGSADPMPGNSVHSSLAAKLEPWAVPILLFAWIAALAGVAIVGKASLDRRRKGLALVSKRTIRVLAALAGVFWLIVVVVGLVYDVSVLHEPGALGALPFWIMLMAFAAGIMFLLMLGLVVTATALWRYGWWLFVLWLVVWAPLSTVVCLGAQWNSDADNDFKGAFFLFGGGAVLVILTAIEVTLFVTWPRISVKYVAHRTSASTQKGLLR